MQIVTTGHINQLLSGVPAAAQSVSLTSAHTMDFAAGGAASYGTLGYTAPDMRPGGFYLHDVYAVSPYCITGPATANWLTHVMLSGVPLLTWYTGQLLSRPDPRHRPCCLCPSSIQGCNTL